MKDTLVFLLQGFVDEPEEVRVDESQDEFGQTVLTASVAPGDMGKVIGKQGRVIKSLRTLMKILAVKQQCRVQIELLESPKK